MVTFNTIPSNLLTPGQYIEFDNSRAVAGLAGKPNRALIMGLRRSTGTVSENVLQLVSTANAADGYFGIGSQLAEMVRAFKLNNPQTETWAVAMDEESGGTAAKITLAVTASSSRSGSIALYIGGYRLLVPIAKDDSATTIATAIKDEINKEVRAPFTATSSSGEVVITFRHKGTSGNSMVPFTNMRVGEALPSGVGITQKNTLTITAGASSDDDVTVTVGRNNHNIAITAATHSTATLVAQEIKDVLNGLVGAGYAVTGEAATLTFEFDMGYGEGTWLAYDPLTTGTTATVGTDGVQGATDPSYANPITAWGADNQWDTIVCPWSDDTNLGRVEDELLARDDGDVMLSGQAFCAVRDTIDNLTAAGNARNSQFMSLVGYPNSPDFPWVVASSVAAVDAGEPDPARPRQAMRLLGLVGPLSSDAQTRSERNTLLSDGVSTLKLGPAGTIYLERLITTYQTNDNAIPDTSYRDITTMRTLSYLRWSWLALISTRYPRHKLAGDGTRFGAGQAIVTPSLMKSEALAWFRLAESAGLVEDFDQFKGDLVCVINDSDPNRLDMQMTFNLVNGLVVFATKMQFVL